MPTPQQQGGDAGTLGGELQPATRHHRQPADFADHRGDSGGAQPFFERPQDVVVARGGDPHDPRRVEPVPGETWAVKIAAFETPQDDAAADSSGDTGGKPGGGGAIFLVGAVPLDFVQRAERQATAGQHLVDRGDAERQHSVAQRARPFDPPDSIA
jgi:hypothetical protein